MVRSSKSAQSPLSAHTRICAILVKEDTQRPQTLHIQYIERYLLKIPTQNGGKIMNFGHLMWQPKNAAFLIKIPESCVKWMGAQTWGTIFFFNLKMTGRGFFSENHIFLSKFYEIFGTLTHKNIRNNIKWKLLWNKKKFMLNLKLKS